MSPARSEFVRGVRAVSTLIGCEDLPQFLSVIELARKNDPRAPFAMIGARPEGVSA